MNKYANLAKQRIVAPNVSHILPFEEGSERHETLKDSSALKKSRLQQSEEANERNRQFVDTSATKKNQSTVKVTMDELLLNKKGSQMQRDVLAKNATKPNSATTSISSGSRRLVDEDDEDEDDLRYQDLNERDREEVTVGELLLSAKGSQMQMVVLTKKATKPVQLACQVDQGENSFKRTTRMRMT